YLSIGTIALLAAVELTPSAEGTIGALEAWGQWPAGVLLLWTLGLGLYGFAGWRAIQALLDPDRKGRSAKGLLARAGQAVSGLTYAGTAISVFALVDALEDLREPDDEASTREAVTQALEMPMGEWIVVAIGLFILGAGVASIVRAFIDRFGRDLHCDDEARTWLGTLGRVGYAGRGVALLPMGLYLTFAGLKARSNEARGLGEALQVLERQPFGDVVLALTALGLVAFGLYALAEAAFRPIRIPDPS
ncbi:MAG: DUF1206 domain-containing protein, partial [Phenylobacterium sp.]|nr:DUF1206 domain-containing protein [Phenylobacterium sp.]